jgi:ferredoxin-NADP reductase
MWRVGTVVALHDETLSARTITLEVPDWPGHVAGQHVDVRLTGLGWLLRSQVILDRLGAEPQKAR